MLLLIDAGFIVLHNFARTPCFVSQLKVKEARRTQYTDVIRLQQKIKLKGKVVPLLNQLCTRHEGVWGSDEYIHIFFTSALAEGVVSFTPRLLYPWGKSLRYPLDRML
jgi:hypothetical protein